LKKKNQPFSRNMASEPKLSKKEQAFQDAKARGNDAMTAGNWAVAVDSYTEALKSGPATYFEVSSGPDPPAAAAVLSNRSLAHLKCHLFDKALQVRASTRRDCICARIARP
jgi:hypothetical protein